METGPYNFSQGISNIGAFTRSFCITSVTSTSPVQEQIGGTSMRGKECPTTELGLNVPFGLPPFTLIGQTLRKVMKHGIDMLLISPWYPQTPGDGCKKPNHSAMKTQAFSKAWRNGPSTVLKQYSKINGMSYFKEKLQNTGISKSASSLIINE